MCSENKLLKLTLLKMKMKIIIFNGPRPPSTLYLIQQWSAGQCVMAISEVSVCEWAYEGKLREIQAAVDADSTQVAKTDSSQRSGLHWACSSGKNDVVKFFISKGAKVQYTLSTHVSRSGVAS